MLAFAQDVITVPLVLVIAQPVGAGRLQQAAAPSPPQPGGLEGTGLWCPLWETRSSSQPCDWPAFPWALSFRSHQVFPKEPWLQSRLVFGSLASALPLPLPQEQLRHPLPVLTQDGLCARIPISFRPDFRQLLCEWADGGRRRGLGFQAGLRPDELGGLF